MCGTAPGGFPCLDGYTAIDEYNVCDGKSHCWDASDESQEVCENWQCPIKMSKCDDDENRCGMVCDGVINCISGSDETNCKEFLCLPWMSKCANGVECVFNIYICNGMSNYNDGSDELCTAPCLTSQLNDKKCL